MNSKERILLALNHQEPDRGDIIKSCGQKDKKKHILWKGSKQKSYQIREGYAYETVYTRKG